MRVALIVPGFSADEGDWCIPALLQHVRALSRQVEVHVFPLRYPHTKAEYHVANARVHPLGGALVRRFRRVDLLRRAVQSIAIQHRRTPFDLLHAYWADEPGAVAVAAGRLIRRPSVVSLAGGELARLPDINYGGQLSSMSRWLVAFALRYAALVTAGSSPQARMAAPFVEPQRLNLLPFGVDGEMFWPDSRTVFPTDRSGSGSFNLLHVGSLVPVKDHQALFWTFSRVAQKAAHVRLHLVGDGPLRGDLERSASEMGLASRIHFHGSVPYDAMPAFFQGADLCLLTSWHEAQCMAVLEAGVCAVGTAGFDVGVLSDLGASARRSQSREVDELARIVSELVERRGRADLLGESARRASESFLLENTVASAISLYRTLARTRDPGGHRPLS